MRKMKKILGSMLILSVVLSLHLTAFAADGYTYKVNVSGGLKGTVSGETEAEMNYGDTWDPADYSVEVTDSKYYFKGFHIAGQEGIVGKTQITQDMNFVAAYGVVGKEVAYTVRYVVGGNTDEATFYGNVGEEITAVAAYYEGYVPTEPEQTITLAKNAASNVVTFEYEELPPGETNIIYDDVIQTTTITGGGGGGTTPAGGGGTTPAGGGAATPAATPGAATPGAGEVNAGDEGVPLANQDIEGGEEGNGQGEGGQGGNQSGESVISEDTQTPQGDIDAGDEEVPKSGGMSNGAKIGIGAAVLAGIAGFLAYFTNRKKREDE